LKRIVADASFCGAWLLPDENSSKADKVLAALLRGNQELWVPSLWIYELVNMLRSAHRRKRMDAEALLEGLDLIAKVGPRHLDVAEGLAIERMARLALQFDLSAYDAAYLELADRFRAPLHTADERLKAAAAKLDLLP
jgi:predicted nucleic acid-binding protein